MALLGEPTSPKQLESIGSESIGSEDALAAADARGTSAARLGRTQKFKATRKPSVRGSTGPPPGSSRQKSLEAHQRHAWKEPNSAEQPESVRSEEPESLVFEEALAPQSLVFEEALAPPWVVSAKESRGTSAARLEEEPTRATRKLKVRGTRKPSVRGSTGPPGVVSTQESRGTSAARLEEPDSAEQPESLRSEEAAVTPPRKTARRTLDPSGMSSSGGLQTQLEGSGMLAGNRLPC